MTDNEIIKALLHWIVNFEGKATDLFILGIAYDLISRQKAEIERLQKYNTEVAFKHYNDGMKDFAERLEELFEPHKTDAAIIWVSVVMNRLLKEMESES